MNDDKPALRLEQGIWYAYGTPWSGKTEQNQNVRVPIAGICFLHQAKENQIASLNGSKAVFRLLEQTVRPKEAHLRIQLMDLLEKLVGHVPIWQMGCNMEPEAAHLSYEVMSGRKDM